MKKIISITIVLCLVFASVLPVYADPWTSQEAQIVTNNSTGILSQITNLNSLFTQFFTIRNISGGNVTATFQDFYELFSSLCSWIIPSNPSQTGLSLWDFMLLVATRVNDLWGGWDSYFSNLTTLPGISNFTFSSSLSDGRMANALGNMSLWDIWNISHNAHSYLWFDPNTSNYNVSQLNGYGTYTDISIPWTGGTPLGNLAVLLRYINYNLAYEYNSRWQADLKHYSDNLTTWDSQGSTLTQVAFTPESAIQGLYRYLAFTQRDVARLAYVFANDEELEARQLAQANQEQIIDDFIDPNGSGSVSASDFSSMAGASDSVKDNFNTGYSSSNIWDIFNSVHYGWFSQECADSLDTTVSNTRTLNSSSGYDTPLLDSYYEQILSLGGDN